MKEDWTGTIPRPLIILSMLIQVVSELSTRLCKLQYSEPDTFEPKGGILW